MEFSIVTWLYPFSACVFHFCIFVYCVQKIRKQLSTFLPQIFVALFNLIRGASLPVEKYTHLKGEINANKIIYFPIKSWF